MSALPALVTLTPLVSTLRVHSTVCVILGTLAMALSVMVGFGRKMDNFETFFTFTDINECVDDVDGCVEGCENTIGSFFCTCFNSGIRANGTICVGMCNRSFIKSG